MESGAFLKRKRRHIGFMRVIDVASALMFPYSFLFFLDPPQNRGTFFWRVTLKIIYSAGAAAYLLWTLRRILPLLKEASTLAQMFVRGLYCMQGTFVCATCGMLVFLVDSPKLGSPLVILPYVIVALVVNRRYIFPVVMAYQPTEEDSRTEALQ